MKLFEPFREPKNIFAGLGIMIALAVLYLGSAVAALVLTMPMPKASPLELVAFALLQTFNKYQATDFAAFIGIPIIGALLFVHARVKKTCRPVPSRGSVHAEKVGYFGLALGMFTAACPICIFALLGLASAASILAPLATAAKLGALAVLAGALVFVLRR